jgi:hypothetical protein
VEKVVFLPVRCGERLLVVLSPCLAPPRPLPGRSRSQYFELLSIKSEDAVALEWESLDMCSASVSRMGLSQCLWLQCLLLLMVVRGRGVCCCYQAIK